MGDAALGFRQVLMTQIDATSIAGMAQRNPLVHYTEKIVADATEHDDRRDGPKDEYGMFPPPLN
jgi:hypothetical protein